jgi:hypothetical protein
MLGLDDLIAFHHGGEFRGHGADVIDDQIPGNRPPRNSDAAGI